MHVKDFKSHLFYLRNNIIKNTYMKLFNKFFKEFLLPSMCCKRNFDKTSSQILLEVACA